MAVQRTTLGCGAVVAAALILGEYTVIKVAITPVAATRIDWVLACGMIAPFGVVSLLLLIAVATRIITDVLELLQRIGQWIKKPPNRSPDADQIPSSSTPSAVPPSSSYGWPSAGSSYTSHPGKEGHRMWP